MRALIFRDVTRLAELGVDVAPKLGVEPLLLGPLSTLQPWNFQSIEPK